MLGGTRDACAMCARQPTPFRTVHGSMVPESRASLNGYQSDADAWKRVNGTQGTPFAGATTSQAEMRDNRIVTLFVC